MKYQFEPPFSICAIYETPELSGKKPRRTNTKKSLQKSTVKTMLIMFYDLVLSIKSLFHKTRLLMEIIAWVLWSICWQELIGFVFKTEGNWSLLHDNAPVHKCIIMRKFFASKSVLVLNHSSYSLNLPSSDFFVPKTKNKAEGKTFRCYFGHPEDFDHLRGRLSAEFSKAIQPL